MFKDFQEYLLDKDIRLTSWQEEAAKVLMDSTEGKRLLSGGIGNGKSFLLNAIDDFSKTVKRDISVERVNPFLLDGINPRP